MQLGHAGPELPKEKTAHINVMYAYIDDTYVDSNSGAYVLPGNHRVTVQWAGNFMKYRQNAPAGFYGKPKTHKPNCTINFFAEEGKSYSINVSEVKKYNRRRYYNYHNNSIPSKEGPYSKHSYIYSYRASASIYEEDSKKIVGYCTIDSERNNK